jgi:hypothetical protein
MTILTPVSLEHLIAGQWVDGSGEELRSINPALTSSRSNALMSVTTSANGAHRTTPPE